MPSELLTERRDATLLLTLSGPGTGNELSEQVCAAGIEALGTAEADPDIRAVVLQGADGEFCAGSGLGRPARQLDEERAGPGETTDRFHDLVDAFRVFPKPVIASVEGAAAGAGFALALACDLIVAAEDARFVLVHADGALAPEGGGTAHLLQALPRQLAAQALWLAEPLSARQLQGHGLVNWVTDKGVALHQALLIAERLAARASPGLVATGKELLRSGR